ncbi:MAG: OadG family transporter subunit [Chloroflexi bacterium]|nr:OadG family transporter subunit [Chloroflexota bacterium]
MGIEFDLSRALLLTYVGVGAAFLVLGSLVVFTGLIGFWGSWRLRKAQAREEQAADLRAQETAVAVGDTETRGLDPQLAAAIGAAVALATEEYNREQSAREDNQSDVVRPDGGGWREQGRMVAFDSRRVRDRDR